MKTRRGFGKIHLKDVRYLKLDMSKETLDSWINFNWDQVKNVYTTKEKFDRGDKYTTITVALNIPYTLLIRSYLIHHDGEKPRTTAEQLTRIGADGLNKEDVIPGTSWAGAFRAHIEDLYRQEILPGLEIDNVFGCIGTKDNSKRSQASAICFEESIVKDGKRVKQVRTAIDRFLGGASKGALYANCPLLNTDGKASTELIIRVLNKSGENDYIVGLMLLCIDELARGMLSVGGETAIGRGIFTVKGVSPDENEKISELVNKNILITGNIGNTVDNEDTGNTGNVGDIPGKTAAYYRKALVEKIKQFQEMAVV
jgi:hypothetical protein